MSFMINCSEAKVQISDNFQIRFCLLIVTVIECLCGVVLSTYSHSDDNITFALGSIGRRGLNADTEDGCP